MVKMHTSRSFCYVRKDYMGFKNLMIFVHTLLIFSFAFANMTIAGNKIEGLFVCSVEHNGVVALEEGRLIADGTISNFENKQRTIKYDLVPLEADDQAWLFNIRLNSNEFHRFYNIPVTQKIIIQAESSLKDNRELKVADNRNTRARLTLSDDVLKFLDEKFIIMMQRYYKNDWEGPATEFVFSKQGMYKIALALNCRNQSDRIEQMIDAVLISYE